MNLVFIFLTFYYYLVAFFKRKVFIKNIRPDDLVLDVGSGDKPFWRADVIVDKYLDDNQQRHSGSVIFDKNRLFFNSDVEDLPFKDNAFDFVFCSHLLEHVENPDKAIKEITRVAKKGYLEVPRAFRDFLQPFPSHLWFCDLKGNTLIFKRREKNKNFYLESTEKFGQRFYSFPLYRYLLAKETQFNFICLYWKKNINFAIQKANGKPFIYQAASKNDQEKSFLLKLFFLFYRLFYLFMTTFFYRKKNIQPTQILKNVDE